MINIASIQKKNRNTLKKKPVLFKVYKKKKHIKGVALENKIGQQESICAHCDSKKSNFLKPIKPIRKQKF